MTTRKSGHPAETVLHLQKALSALIDLSLQAKQAHWNCTGPHFKPVHLQLDELVDVVRGQYDEIAERIATLGHAAEGGLSATAKRSPIEPFRDGFVEAIAAATVIAKHLRKVIAIVREGIDATSELDPVSQDLLIETASVLEKQLWMLEVLKR
jgi:starvation-inducible DNA-binding protein